MSEENKASVRRFFEEGFVQGNVAALDSIIAADVVDHNPLPGQGTGRQGFKDLITTIRGAFPDFHITIEDQVSEGDKVVTRITNTGTHKGEFLGIPATNKQVSLSMIHLDRFSNGLVVEHWDQGDMLGLMQQLGAIPGP